MQKQLRLEQLVAVVSSGFRTLFEEFEFWCTAEIADLKPYKSRLYLDLIEANESGAILAKAKGIIWEPSIMQKFMKAAGVRRTELVGMTVLFRGNCTFHEKYGRSITIKELSSEYTRGKQVTHRDTVIKQLQDQGIRQLNKETALPASPLTLAVITGHGSAGYEDFTTIIQESGYHYTIHPFWSAVHGNQALEEVPKHLHTIYTQLKADASIYDAVLLVRGGGGKDGFLWQDDHTIAKLVSAIAVPVIVAVGHTRDTTLLDLNCRYAAKTPSEAAMRLIDHTRTTENTLHTLYDRIQEYSSHRREHYRESVQMVYEKIVDYAETRYQNKKLLSEELYQKILRYDLSIQLKHGYTLVTDSEGRLVDGALIVGKDYKLYHGTTSYRIEVKNAKK